MAIGSAVADPITLNLPMPPSVNELYANRKPVVKGFGRRRTEKYERWRTEAGWSLKLQKPKPVLGAVSIHIDLEDSDGRITDADGRLKAPIDLLVAHRVIEGDSKKFVRRVSAEWRKDIKGARVVVTPAGEG